MKQIIVGNYSLGFETVQLVAREGTGGEYYTQPEPGSIARIKVGITCPSWDEVINTLLHEALEFAIDRRHGRHRPTQDQSLDHSNYIFVFDHHQFSDCCSKVAEFITPAMPPLMRIWKKNHKVWRQK